MTRDQAKRALDELFKAVIVAERTLERIVVATKNGTNLVTWK